MSRVIRRWPVVQVLLYSMWSVRSLNKAYVLSPHPLALEELVNDYVFVFAGGEPPFGFLRQIGVRFGGEAAPAAHDAAKRVSLAPT